MALNPRPRNLSRRARRNGVAASEFAVCLPLLFTLVFGVIEVSNAVFMQQALTSAAYEAANVASATGGTSAAATTRAQAVLTSLGVKSPTITISPAVTATTPVGTTITVTCSAPLSANSVSYGFFSGTPTARIVIPRL